MYWIVSCHVFGNCIYAFVYSNMSLCITNVCQWRQYWFHLLRPFYCYSGSHRTSKRRVILFVVIHIIQLPYPAIDVCGPVVLSMEGFSMHIVHPLLWLPRAYICILDHICHRDVIFFIIFVLLYSEIVAFTGEIRICIKRVYVNKL